MRFYQLILSVETAVDAADTGEERTQEVKQRLEERIIYTPLPVQTCAYVCVRTKKKKKIQAPHPSLPVLSSNDREGSFTALFYS